MKPYYQHDGITLYHGDCREIIPLLSGFDLILTDPQYQLANGKRATTMGRTVGRCKGGRNFGGTMVDNRDHGIFKGDEAPFDPKFLLDLDCPMILWGGIHYASKLPNSTRWLVWDKRDGVASDDNADCEMAWTNLKGPARLYRHLWKGIVRAGEENIAVAGAKLHPFQKPVALMRWCLSLIPVVEMVLDPYSGSGTTLRAAKDLSIPAIGIELEERYCEVTVRRLEQGVLEFTE